MYGKPHSGADPNRLFFFGSEATNFFSKVVAGAVGLEFFFGDVTTTKIFSSRSNVRHYSHIETEKKNRHDQTFVIVTSKKNPFVRNTF